MIPDTIIPSSRGRATLTRRSALRRGAAATAFAGAGLTARPSAAQEANPVPGIDVVPGTIGTIFSAVADSLPAGPVEITLARSTAQPGDGDLEDYFTFPGPFAFIVESGEIFCRCGTADDPCLLLRADGTSEPAPPVPTDVRLGPGEGLYIPANVPDSFTIPGTDPEVELDLSIFPVAAPATPTA